MGQPQTRDRVQGAQQQQQRQRYLFCGGSFSYLPSADERKTGFKGPPVIKAGVLTDIKTVLENIENTFITQGQLMLNFPDGPTYLCNCLTTATPSERISPVAWRPQRTSTYYTC